ncbi:hypothetical protein MtrunA17_Chr3g0104891 [Medicago truncatula]|uniref:Uncharacterized protein n=1 Tax=Medicago truncatula TaxID=3880 RepID=A0A396IT30_MEDTR|nr:hypothetical protein MtrunA17_Chr3g0104891 [Medicago truncatula]
MINCLRWIKSSSFYSLSIFSFENTKAGAEGIGAFKGHGLPVGSWVMRGVRGTIHIEARTTAQARETPHFYPQL